MILYLYFRTKDNYAVLSKCAFGEDGEILKRDYNFVVIYRDKNNNVVLLKIF